MFRGNPENSGVYDAAGVPAADRDRPYCSENALGVRNEGTRQNGTAWTGPDGTPNYEAAFASDFYDDMITGVSGGSRSRDLLRQRGRKSVCADADHPEALTQGTWKLSPDSPQGERRHGFDASDRSDHHTRTDTKYLNLAVD